MFHAGRVSVKRGAGVGKGARVGEILDLELAETVSKGLELCSLLLVWVEDPEQGDIVFQHKYDLGELVRINH